MQKGKLWFLIGALFAVLCPAPVQAEVVVAFYSRELDVGFRTDFPHAFVVVRGKLADGRDIDTNYGFTAKSVSPALLLGSVKGEMETLKPSYYLKSEKQFEVKISDAQYGGLLALVEKWRALPGKSYNLDKRNCIHFVSDVAQTLGLKSEVPKKLVRKPRGFLQYVKSLNPWLGK